MSQIIQSHLQDILGNFSAAFYTPMVAANKIQKNTIAAVFLCIMQFVLLYILFEFGLGPLWARYLAILSTCLFSFVVKPYILWKDVDYSLKEIYICIWQCVKILVVVIISCFILNFLVPQETIMSSAIVFSLSILIVIVTAFAFMKPYMRKKCLDFLIRKIHINHH